MSEPKSSVTNCDGCGEYTHIVYPFGSYQLCEDCLNDANKAYSEDQHKYLSEILDPRFLPEKF